MFGDRNTLIMSGLLTLAFIACCLIDVTGIYPLMENFAVILVFVSVFVLIIINIYITNQKKESKKKLPKPEEDSSEFRQI
jgi:4-hydroxybenzoate polyprenyltransferase